MTELNKNQQNSSMVIGILFLGLAVISLLGFAAELLLVVLCLAGWRLIPEFWKTLGRSLLAGVGAGVLVLGPGFRLAMRVVAITDAETTPEFSIGGTLGIIAFVGVISGGLLAVGGVFLRQGLSISKPRTAAVMAVGSMLTIVAIEDLRSELLHLGNGGWMNIPMFLLFGFAFGLLAMSLYDRLTNRSLHDAPAAEAMA